MKLIKSLALGLGAVLACSGMAQADTAVIPMGTIQYNPAKAWNSYVILAGSGSAKLIDRNGNLVKEWDVKGGQGFPAKVFPGGHVGVSLYPGLSTGFQDSNTLAILDFDGNIVRQFNGWQKVDKGEKVSPPMPTAPIPCPVNTMISSLKAVPPGITPPVPSPSWTARCWCWPTTMWPTPKSTARCCWTT